MWHNLRPIYYKQRTNMEKLGIFIFYYLITPIIGQCPDEEKCCFGLG